MSKCPIFVVKLETVFVLAALKIDLIKIQTKPLQDLLDRTPH